MTIKLPIIPATAALTAALFLSACGKQEAVGDVPSGEELAKQADAASAAIRAEAAKADQDDDATAVVDSSALTSYTNTLRGYTIMVPKDWTVDEAASDDNGNVYKAPNTGAKLAVSWVENREDAAMKNAIATVDEAGDAMTGDNVSQNEYRASGKTGENSKTRLRIFRKPDGTMVSAQITYPAESAASSDALAKQVLDSLTLQ